MPRKVGVSAGAVTRSVRGRRAHGRAHGPAAAAQGAAQLWAETALGRKMEFEQAHGESHFSHLVTKRSVFPSSVGLGARVSF